MKTMSNAIKYLLALAIDIFFGWFSLATLFSSLYSIGNSWLFLLGVIVYMIIRGIFISLIFQNLKHSAYIYSTFLTTVVFIFLAIIPNMTTIVILVTIIVFWFLSFITIFVPWSIYDKLRKNKEKEQKK